MTTLASGRLGNQMGEYATLFAIKRLYNISAVTLPPVDKNLRKIFDGLSLQRFSG